MIHDSHTHTHTHTQLKQEAEQLRKINQMRDDNKHEAECTGVGGVAEQRAERAAGAGVLAVLVGLLDLLVQTPISYPGCS